MQEVLEAKEREVQRLTEGQREVREKGSPGSPVSEDLWTLIPTSGGFTGLLGSCIRGGSPRKAMSLALFLRRGQVRAVAALGHESEGPGSISCCFN